MVDRSSDKMSTQRLIVFIAVSIILLAGWLLHGIALPKPIPDIPFNEEATRSIFGDVPSFMRWHAKRPELYIWISSKCVKHNSPVIQLFMRPLEKPWVVLADFREAQDIVARRTQDFDRSAFFRDLLIGILHRQQAHMPTGDKWRAHRKPLGDTMNPRFLNEVVGPQIYNSARDMIELWKLKARLAEGRPYPVIEVVDRRDLDAIWSATFGNQTGTTKG